MRDLPRRFAFLLLGAICLYAPSAQPQGGSSVSVFGPKKYLRTTGAPNEYTDTFNVPAWVVSPFALHIQNGEPDGDNRVSSATIKINGKTIVKQSDFNQNVATIDRQVTLTAKATLKVTLASQPGSFLIINLGGASADHTPPSLAVAKPTEGQALKTATPAFEITYDDPRGSEEPAASGVNTATLSVTLDGTDRTELFEVRPDGASATLPLELALADGTHTLEVTVADRAGNAAPKVTRTFVVDTVAPTITAAAAPPPNAAGWNNADVTVTFTCEDAGSGVATCPEAPTITAEGAEQKITGTAEDKAGNTATASVTVSLDKTPPTITATVTPAPNAAGWSGGDVTVTFTCADALSGVASCPAPLVVSTEGAGQVVQGTATDAAGNTATASATVNLDRSGPSITAFVTPDQLPPGGSGSVSVEATDNVAIASVAFLVDGQTVATVTAPPYQLELTVPAEAQAGDTLTVTVVVTDAAGNTATASRGVAIAAQGVVVGQVLADATSLPLPGAVVQVVGGGQQDASGVADSAGRYALPADRSHLFLRIGKPGMLPVEREVAVQSGVGTVAVDARLTAAASPVEIDSAGGTLSADNVAVAVPSGAVSGPTPFSLTRLSGQGLPALLPLGWSPVAAFDLSIGGAAGGSFAAGFSGVPVNRPLQLVTYDSGAHAWLLVEPDLTSPDGVLAATLPAPGGYALVLADETDPPLAAPAVGQPLPGASMVLVPPDAVSSGTLAPPSLSPAGGTAMATLTVFSSLPLPSGTILQATVTEQYTPTSGEPISEAARPEDLVLYRHRAPAGAALAAEFPVTPSRSFAVADLLSGKVHLDILAGREGTRGQTGGSGPVVVQSGDAQLAVAAGSLPEDTAIALLSVPLAGFLPSGNGLTPLAQFFLDFSGRILGLPAQLSSSAGSAQPGDTLLLARIERFDGVARLVAVSLAQVVGERIVSQPYPGLPGITRGGEYVFYRSAQPLGFVSGLVSAGGGPVSALVQTDELPFVTLSDATGRYTIPAVAGTAHLRASVPRTALLATGSVAVTAGETAALDLNLAGLVTAATVAPPDGAVGVDPTAAITITAAVALNPATVIASNIQLFEVGSAGNQPVAVRFVLAQGNRQVSVFPLAVLQPSTRYTLQVSGLATAVGGLVAVPSVSFTTRAVTPPNFNPDALLFGFPNDEGNVAVSAPANSFPPGSRVQIVNQTNGVVLTLTVLNDGSVSGELPATIDDVLEVTVTAPDTSTATFTRTQFVAPDGTVAVGSHGGTVTGEGGVELRVPEGALVRAVRLKIEAFGPERFPERPEVPHGHFGSGLKVSSPDRLDLKKELDLAFPKPAEAPDGAFYYVYRRLATEDNEVAFEVIDQAFVEGDKVVTSSAPFPGFITGMAGLGSNAVTAPLAGALEESYFYLQWSFESLLVGVASQGVIVGKVRRIVPPAPGEVDPTFVGISGAMVFLTDDDQLTGGGTVPSQMAVSQADGTFSIWDRKLGGGTRKVKAVVGNESVEATAFEVNAAEADPVFFPNLETFRYYRNVAKVNIAFPALAPPPPAPQVDVRLFTLDADDLRVPATGVVQSGTSLVIAFESNATVTGATAGGVPQTVTTPDLPDNPQDPLRFDARVAGTYTVGPPGLYTVVATALPPLGGPAVTGTRSFLAVAAGGNNTTPTPGPPAVVDTSPLDNAEGVATTAFPQVTFSEPVTGVPGNVTLVDSSGTAASLQLIGIKPDGSVANPVKGTDAITALTIQPTTGLKFGEDYTVTLGSGIVDLDEPPLHLEPFTLHFTTFGPVELGGTPPFSSTRPVILGQRAYVSKVSGIHSSLNIIDISDPANPVEVGTPQFFVGRAIDIAGLEASPVTGGPLVAVAAGVGSFPLPSNVWIYDVSNPDVPERVAAVSATTSAGQEGTLLRIAMKGGFIYTSTFPKGIQVIDVRDAVAIYQERRSQFGRLITTEGQGFATDAVVNTIELRTGQGGIATMYDVEVGDFVTAASGANERLVVATGRLPFVVVDPLQSGPLAVLYPPRESGTTGLSSAPLQSADGRFKLELGFTVAIGTLQQTDAAGNSSALPVAVVAGHGSATTGGTTAAGVPILAVVDLSDPRHPAPLGFMKLPEFAVDIVLKDSLALIGTGAGNVRLISLTDPANPTDAGAIVGAFGDRLAVSDSGVIVTASYNGAIGGIHTSSLGVVPIVTVEPEGLIADIAELSTTDLTISYKISGDLSQVRSATIKIQDDRGQIVFSSSVPVRASGQIVWPKGQRMKPTPTDVQLRVMNPDGSESAPFTAQPEIEVGLAITPVLTGISPSRLHQGTTNAEVTLTGRNFTLGAIAILTRQDNGTSTTLTPQFIDTKTLKLQIPDKMLSALVSWSVSVEGFSDSSDSMDLKVVPAGTPESLVLTALEPQQLPSSFDPADTWITLKGSNFSASDTLVVAEAIPAFLETEFVSPSTIRALVPASWLTEPGAVEIHLESAEDPGLTSDSRVLEILNTIGIPLEPVYPKIAAVNDGFIPLPPAGVTTPLKIKITGEGFQSGAEILASIAGEERHLSTATQSSSEIQADLPADFWVQKNFTVTLVTETQTAQQGTNPPAARVQVPQGKASFRELKLPRLYSQGGQYSHYKPRKGCLGYHEHKIGNGPVERSLMVPAEAGIGNGTKAKIDGSKELFKQGLVSFVVDTPSLASNSPTVAQKKEEDHDIQGQGPRHDAIVPLRVQQANNSPTPFDLGSLGLQLIPTRNFVVNVHFITTLNGRNKPRLTPRANDTEGMNRLLAGFTKKINEIWEPQTRVHFTFSAPSTWPEPINYDLDGDDKLSLRDFRIQTPSGQIPVEEAATIAFATVPPLVQGNPNRDAKGNPIDGSLHLYFVKDFVQPFLPSIVLGFAAAPIGTRYLFVQDASGTKDELAQTIAHELGHALGLYHNSQCLTLPCQDSQLQPPPTPPGVPVIPSNDSDFRDKGSLMWYNSGPNGCRIGLHHWEQLNHAHP